MADIGLTFDIPDEIIENEIDKIIESALLRCVAFQELLALEEINQNESDASDEDTLRTTSEESSQPPCFVEYSEDDEIQNNEKKPRIVNTRKPIPELNTDINRNTGQCKFGKQYGNEWIPFQLKWSYGINMQVPITHLRTGELVLASSHFVSLFNYKTNQMTFKSGFTGRVSCITYAENFLAACDSVEGDGLETSKIIVWSIGSAEPGPQHCWEGRVPGGFCLLQWTSDAQTILAVSHGPNPFLLQWQIYTGQVTVKMLPREFPAHLQVDWNDCFVITFPTKIVQGKTGQTLAVQETDRPKGTTKIGLYSTSAFLDGTIITGTSRGVVIVTSSEGSHVKTIQLQNSGISNLQSIDGKLIVGFQDGNLCIYDGDILFKTCIIRLSSAINSFYFRDLESGTSPEYAYLSSCGTLGVVSKSTHQFKIRFPNSHLLSLDSHPSKATIVAGYANGQVLLYNMKQRTIERIKWLQPHGITAMRFSKNGSVIGVGTESGNFFIIDSCSLVAVQQLETARAAISHIKFQQDRNVVACAYKDGGVALFRLTVDWHSRGKYRPHTAPLTGVCFVSDSIFTIGEDRMLVELDARHMLRFVGSYKVELSAIPTSLIFVEGQILIANNERKVRFFDVVKKVIVRTVRSPGREPIHAMVARQDQLVVAAGRDMGVCRLPWRGWAPLLTAHPTKIANIALAEGNVITAGLQDSNMLIWAIRSGYTSAHELPQLQRNIINQLFRAGPMDITQLPDCLRCMGYCPSTFDVENINREYADEQITEKKFHDILFNYGPPPDITEQAIRDALLSISDMSRGVITTNALIEAVTSKLIGDEALSRDEALSALQSICDPSIVPSTFTLQHLKKLLRNKIEV